MSINTERMYADFRKYIPLILQNEINNPRIGIVSVNEVKASKDGRTVLVYVSFLGSVDPDDNFKALKKVTGYVRTSLAKKMKVRYIPEILFVHDDLYDKLDSLSRAINS